MAVRGQGSGIRGRSRANVPRACEATVDLHDAFLRERVRAYSGSGRSKGKRITSRIVCELVNSITSRSMPIPSPPAGGMP